MSSSARVSAGPPSGIRGFHVALDLDLARRSAASASASVGTGALDTILVNGFLLFDCGGYDLCTAHLPDPVFWRMKAIDLLGREDSAGPPLDETGTPPATVWQVEAALHGPSLGHLTEWNRQGGFDDGGAADAAGAGADRIFRLDVTRVVALDRVWIGRRGLRLCASVLAEALLPETPR